MAKTSPAPNVGPIEGEVRLTRGASKGTGPALNAPALVHTAEQAAGLRRVREDLIQKTAARAAGAAPAADAPPAAPPEKPREDVDSVEVKLPNGLVVEFGPPAGVALTFKLAQILGDMVANPGANMAMRILMCVRKIEGIPVAMPQNMVEAQGLANRISDDGLDHLASVYMTYWPNLTVKDLGVLKKNLRQS